MANSVTARFNDDCKVLVAMSDDTTVSKAVIIDAEGNETDIGGGGGSSDFTTAKVTFICNVEEVGLSMSMTSEAEPPYTPNASSNYNTGLYKNDEIDISAILYKGLCLGEITSNSTLAVAVTGDIEVFSNSALYIRGAGTVTINQADS